MLYMYTELLNKYVSLMEKIYLNSTTKYCQELIKLIYTKPEKFSLTLTEELSKEFSIWLKRGNKIQLKI